MMLDPISNGMPLLRRKGFVIGAAVAALIVFAGSFLMYVREFSYEGADLYVHAMIAADFDFSDLHTITSRLSYPVWHILVSALYQLGMPLIFASAGVCAFFKTLTFALTCWLVSAMAGKEAKGWLVLAFSLFLMVVTGVRIPSVAENVYRGVGSPNVWHNPTQQAVTASMLMVLPWLCHCWYTFEHMRAEGQTHIMLPWWKIVVLAVLCVGSVACKPTFMQALLPAAFVMYAVEVFRHKGEWRYFGQIVLAFLPSVGYFLLSYLYYTGVVVEFTSGVEIGITAETAWAAIRSALMMSLCPLAAVAVCWRKGLFRNRMLVLALLMILFSALEAMAFRETGLRAGHGNFTWAASSSSFFLWVVMAGIFLRCFLADLRGHAMTLWRKGGYAVVGGLFVWHAYSAAYYLWYLLSTKNAF